MFHRFRSLPAAVAATAIVAVAPAAVVRAADWSDWQPLPDRYQTGIDIRIRENKKKNEVNWEYQFRNRYRQKVTVKVRLDGMDSGGAVRQVEDTVVLEPGEQKVKKDAQKLLLTKLTNATLLDIQFEGGPPAAGSVVPATDSATDVESLKKALSAAREDLKDAEADETQANLELASVRASYGTNKSGLSPGDLKEAEDAAQTAVNRAAAARRHVAALEKQIKEVQAAAGAAAPKTAAAPAASPLTAASDTKKVNELLAAAQKSANAGDWPKATETLRTVLAEKSLKDSDRAVLSANLGLALRNQNRYEEAVSALNDAVRLAPENAQFKGSLGSVLLDSNKPADAERILRDAVAQDAKDANLQRNLAYALYQQNKLADAEKFARDAVAKDAKDADGHMILGMILDTADKGAEAAAQFQEALKIAPENPAYHTSLAISLARQNKLPAAEAEFRQAVRLAPNVAGFQDNLGTVLFSQQKYAEAEAAYKEAVRLDASNPQFQQHLKNAQEANKKK